MERETGIEPVASSLGSWRSTAELLPLTSKSKRPTLVSFLVRFQKMIQIIIPGELICKKCSIATLLSRLRLMVQTAPGLGLLVSQAATFGPLANPMSAEL
jgi:hypothetical protein